MLCPRALGQGRAWLRSGQCGPQQAPLETACSLRGGACPSPAAQRGTGPPASQASPSARTGGSLPCCGRCHPPRRYEGQGERAQPSTGKASRAQTRGQWLCPRLRLSSRFRNARACPLASPPLCKGPSPCWASPRQQEPLRLPPGAAGPLPAPDDNLFYVLCLQPVSRLSLYSCAVSSDAAFFPITSCLIQTFLKAPFHASQLPRVAPAGLDRQRGPSSSKWGPSLPLPTPHSRSHNTHFHIKSHPSHPGHRSFQKAGKIHSTRVK